MIVQDIAKLQRDLESTVQGLEAAKHDLLEKDRLLRSRDELLERSALESRRLNEALDKERSARKQDKMHFAHQQREHQSVTRTMEQQITQIEGLKAAQGQDRRRREALEDQYRHQLEERNNLLLALWRRLSTVCGQRWVQQHGTVNNQTVNMEVISNNLPGFNKSVILAMKEVENSFAKFRSQVKNIEISLMRDYHTLQANLDIKFRKLETLEAMVRSSAKTSRASSTRSGVESTGNHETAELIRLRAENKHLRSEIEIHKRYSSDDNNPATIAAHHAYNMNLDGAGLSQLPRPPSGVSASPRDAARSSVAATLLRAHSTSVVETMNHNSHARGLGIEPIQDSHDPSNSAPFPTVPTYTSHSRVGEGESKWFHRLKELERRLKAEREGRLVDRSGARKRLEEQREENSELRARLEREMEVNRVLTLEGGHAGSGGGGGGGSSSGEGQLMLQAKGSSVSGGSSGRGPSPEKRA
jgi:hypothetical protein